MLSINRKLSHKGFSLIELMVAVAILGMAIFGIFNAYSVSFMGMVDARNVTVATNYAREKMEEIKNKLFENIITDNDYIVILETKFKRKVTVAEVKNSEDEVIDELIKVTTVVIWDDRNGIQKDVKLETLIYNND